MTEEDLSALVTSIDENDIIIIPSNGSEMTDQLDFLPDHFTVNNPHADIPVAPVQPIHPTARTLIREDSEEFEDETIMERLHGLTEMFPNWLYRFFQQTFHYSKHIGAFMKKSIWFCSSSFVVLILPILVQMEFSQVAELQAAQTREILLGPSAHVGAQSTLGLH